MFDRYYCINSFCHMKDYKVLKSKDLPLRLTVFVTSWLLLTIYDNFMIISGLQIRLRNWKIFSLFLNQNICCGYSKEPSQYFLYFSTKTYVVCTQKILFNIFFISQPKHMLCVLKRTVSIFSLFHIQNICCGYSKEPSQWDGSFEHQNTCLKMGKKTITILRS